MRPWATGASCSNASRPASCGGPACPWPRSPPGSGVSKSSVTLWVRDVSFKAAVARSAQGRRRDPNALQRRKQGEIERLLEEGRARIGRLSEREFLVAGVALYAGEGAKRDGALKSANSDPRMIFFFCC